LADFFGERVAALGLLFLVVFFVAISVAPRLCGYPLCVTVALPSGTL
jgi:hypothetical protein